MVERTLSQAKPILVGAAALGAGVLALGLFKLAGRRPRRKGWTLPQVQQQPSLFGTIVRSALASVVASLAGRFMEQLQRKLEPKLGAPPTDLPAPRIVETGQP